MGYLVHLLILIGIYLLLTQSFNLIFGLGRLLNLAHVSAYAIGAYVTALLATEQGLSFWLCAPLSMLGAALLSLLISAISLKLDEDYFAIGSLAFNALINAVLINWKSLTHGVLGITGIPRPEFWGIDFYNNWNFLILVVVVDLLALVVLHRLFNSRLARDLRAQAESPTVARALGKSPALIRSSSFAAAAVFAGLAGSLFAYYINYIDPSSFGLSEMVFILSIVVIGRPGSFWGAIAATVFLVLLPEPLRFINFDTIDGTTVSGIGAVVAGIGRFCSENIGHIRQLLYALILFAVIYWKRRTIFPSQRTI